MDMAAARHRAAEQSERTAASLRAPSHTKCLLRCSSWCRFSSQSQRIEVKAMVSQIHLSRN
eukprot:5787181-Amphidinium_carterae.2